MRKRAIEHDQTDHKAPNKGRGSTKEEGKPIEGAQRDQ